MSSEKDVLIPDIGNAKDVDVIEILVAAGDTVAKDDSIITLESDKASMDIPCPQAGTVKAVKVKVGDKVSQGDLVLILEAAEAAESATESKSEPTPAATPDEPSAADDATATATEETISETKTEEKTVTVPDIGNAKNVDVIEVSVKVGDQIAKDDSLITLESDKASMEIPAPYAGEVTAVSVAVGDKVSQGDAILVMQARSQSQPSATKASTESPAAKAAPASQPATQSTPSEAESSTTTSQPSIQDTGAYAGPAVRRFAHELGVDLTQVKGSGRKGRIMKEDVQGFVKARLQGGAASAGPGLDLPPLPDVDFSQFGDVEVKPLSRINKLSAKYLHRNWVQVPHVTQFDEADITEMEAFRKAQKQKAEQQGFKLTPLVFIMKAVVAALKQHARFNSSLHPSGESLIFKKYFHIGVAVDTPEGLVVPVIRDVDKKSLFDLAGELATVSERARDKKLTSNDMQGSSFTISSLGGIGGTAFTPIVNLPDVAILGVSKAAMKPLYQDGKFVPRLMLPLSLSYDHRVIDGAEGARFCRTLVNCLGDIRTLLL